MKFKEVRRRLAVLLCATMALTAVPLTAFGYLKDGEKGDSAGDYNGIWPFEDVSEFNLKGWAKNGDYWESKVAVTSSTEFQQLAEGEPVEITFTITPEVTVATASNAKDPGEVGHVIDKPEGMPSGADLVGFLQEKTKNWTAKKIWEWLNEWHFVVYDFQTLDGKELVGGAIDVEGVVFDSNTITFKIRGKQAGHAWVRFGSPNDFGDYLNPEKYATAVVCVCAPVNVNGDISLYPHIHPAVQRKVDALSDGTNRNVGQAVIDTFRNNTTYVKFKIDESVFKDIPGGYVDADGNSIKKVYPKFYIKDISVDDRGVPYVSFYLDYLVRFDDLNTGSYKFISLADTGVVDFIIPVVKESVRGASNKYVRWTKDNGNNKGLAMLGEYGRYSIIDKTYSPDLPLGDDDGSLYDEGLNINYEHTILRTSSIQGTYTMEYVPSIDTYGSVSAGYGVTTYSSNKGTTEDKSTTFDAKWEATSDGKWKYKFNDGTYPKSRWVEITYNGVNNWYYFDENGIMKTGWFEYPMDGNWYYMHPYADGDQGYMYTGWHQIDGVWYYFNETSDGTKGRMYANETTPDGLYSLDASGAWIQ